MLDAKTLKLIDITETFLNIKIYIRDSKAILNKCNGLANDNVVSETFDIAFLYTKVSHFWTGGGKLLFINIERRFPSKV